MSWRIHPIKLKRQIARQYLAGGVSYKSLSLKYGIPQCTISLWLRKVRDGDLFMTGERDKTTSLFNTPIGCAWPRARPRCRVRAHKPKSLFHFLAWKGGLRQDQELRAIFDTSNPPVPGLGKLVRKSGGMSLDTAREACIEEGFLQDNESHAPSINDLLALIAAEARGNKQYRIHEALDAWEFSEGGKRNAS
jgi:hypothetical protein